MGDAATSVVTQVAVAKATGTNPFARGEKSDGAVTKVHTHALDTVALAGIGTSAATMALTSGATAKAASGLTIAFSPYAAYQKRQVNEVGTLRDQNNRLRENVNGMMQENDKLKANVDRLEGSVTELEDVEKDLAKLANTDNLDRLVEVVKETKRVTANIKKALEADVMFQVMEVLMKSDQNRDFIIGPKEINMMILRMKMVSGVKFNEKNFRAKVAAEGNMSLTSIMDLFRDLEDDGIAEEDAIFVPDLQSMKK
uniref:Uncharacterized protein n=1 Tax=Helicotheca tamesis TaxID=374047 RepID=A0A7S2GX79_9STRA|mmetsp:Transcript_12998/g.17871  ORF Transcript_12998/g.17871 Transcript_12998/m.17871 type:complete len:255 (+) Transcript_12998:214-978(+)|eukprot:CAMPEP_0185728564 /NCGR_PEP_ID=MMETSP1171-20130828/3887_1 /TAXON_ID=374046 /ORGANISM="Helicotheca tamensis, Strain CCMP826" /LENGTH=254 /DNA_ID=CAMNT_0028397287 /DNA_START=139 /DNA_END=903 /DNA_ORIENTATION=+